MKSTNLFRSGSGKPAFARLLPALVVTCLLALPALAAVAALAEPARVDLSLAIEPDDRREYYDGEYISFYLSLEREGYVYLFYLDTEGNLLQLLPNAEMSNHWYPQGNQMPFPSLEEPIDYVIVPPFGDELLRVFVSDNPQIDFPGKWRESGIRELDIDLEQVEDLIFDASSDLFGRAELSFESRPAPD